MFLRQTSINYGIVSRIAHWIRPAVTPSALQADCPERMASGLAPLCFIWKTALAPFDWYENKPSSCSGGILYRLSRVSVASSLSRQSRDEFAFVGFGFDFAVEAGVQEFVEDGSESWDGFEPHGFKVALVEDIKSIMPAPLRVFIC